MFRVSLSLLGLHKLLPNREIPKQNSRIGDSEWDSFINRNISNKIVRFDANVIELV